MLKFFNLFRKKAPTPAIVEGEFLWCIVGNIVDKHYFGEEKEIRRGTKHFRPGAKVYCLPRYAGKSIDKVGVIGKPRKSDDFITIIMQVKYITNFRLQKVYSPSLFDKISRTSLYRTNLNYQPSVEQLEKLMELYSKQTEEVSD